MKKNCIIIALVCMLACTGCADKNSDKNEPPQETITQEVTSEISDQATTEEFTMPDIPKLSAEIPSEAVVKSTVIKKIDGETKFKRIEYLNEYGDVLLSSDVDLLGDYETVNLNCRYKYDHNGNITYRYYLTSYCESEYTYEYDNNGNNISIEEIQNGTEYHTEEMKYDEYNNLISRQTYTVYESNGEKVSRKNRTFKTNLSYDKFGNIISYKYHENDEMLYSAECEYNFDNCLIKEVLTYPDGEISSTSYEYVPGSDEISLIEFSSDTDGEMKIYQREKLTYDDRMRNTSIEDEYLSKNSTTVFEYIYEDL